MDPEEQICSEFNRDELRLEMKHTETEVDGTKKNERNVDKSELNPPKKKIQTDNLFIKLDKSEFS